MGTGTIKARMCRACQQSNNEPHFNHVAEFFSESAQRVFVCRCPDCNIRDHDVLRTLPDGQEIPFMKGVTKTAATRLVAQKSRAFPDQQWRGVRRT